MSQIKGVYHATAPTVRDGQNEDIQLDVNGNTKQTLATGLNKVNDSVTSNDSPCDSAVSKVASFQALSGPGILYGFKIVSFTDGATIRFSDALTATTPYVSSAQTISAALGYSADEVILIGGPKGMLMATGCYVTITGTIEIIPLVKLD